MQQDLLKGDLSGLKTNLIGSSHQNDYTKLYSCKHFRNRVLRLQALIAELQLDAILLIQGKSRHRFNFEFYRQHFTALHDRNGRKA